jgi:hypothetical protein
VTALDNAGHGLQDRQQFVLGGLQDDHLSTFGGFFWRPLAAGTDFSINMHFRCFLAPKRLENMSNP